MHSPSVMRATVLCAAMFALHATAGMAGSKVIPPQTGVQEKIFAKVNGEVVTLEQYLRYLKRALRKKFYHGKIPAEQLKSFRRTTADALVERVLLSRAAQRQGIKFDTKAIDSRVKQLNERNSAHRGWAKRRKKTLTQLRKVWRKDNLIEQLQTRVKNIPAPSDPQVLAYYHAFPEKFTTPEQLRLSLILLRVDPSSGSAVWRAARDEADRLVLKLHRGAAFAELARIHSADRSAKDGGDMGYVHQGMLAPAVQQILEPLQADQIAAPISLLQGVAIFRLDGRLAPRLNDFVKVKARARELWLRDAQLKAWDKYRLKLRSEAKIQIDETFF